MKNRKSPYHITWYITLALVIILAIAHSSWWWAPLAVYFVCATASIVILAITHDKVKKLPVYAKKAFKKTFKR